MTEATAIVEKFRQLLLNRDLNGFADLLSADAELEYPFGFPGAPRQISGREQIRAHLIESRQRMDEIDLRDLHLTAYQTTDPEVVITELAAEGTVRATGKEFRFPSSINVIRVRDGEIVLFRDYTNILGVAEHLNRLPELAAMLSGGASA